MISSAIENSRGHHTQNLLETAPQKAEKWNQREKCKIRSLAEQELVACWEVGQLKWRQ